MIHDYGVIRSIDEAKALADRLGSSDKAIGFDIETGYDGPDREKGSLYPHENAFIVGFSITDGPKWARYIPLRHDSKDDNLDPDTIWDIFKPVLEQPRIVCHHEKFESKFLKRVGINLGVVADTAIEAYILAEFKQKNLKDLCYNIFGHKMMKIEDLFNLFAEKKMTEKQIKCMRFNRLPVTPEVVEYGCEDSAWTWAIDAELRPRCLQNHKFMFQLEMAISKVLAEMEDWGVAVAWDEMKQHQAEGKQFKAKFGEAVREKLAEQTGRSMDTFNPNSHPQVREVLYNELGLRVSRMTKGSEKNPPKPSTDRIALTRIAKSNEAVRLILQMREVNNLNNRFKKWLSFDQAQDGRIHPGYNQVTVGSGRFSANDPPVQQQPKKWSWTLPDGEEWKGNFRNLTKAEEGWYLLTFDWSQAELRTLAGLAQEPYLLDAYAKDIDVHKVTAALISGIDISEVTDEIRDKGKTYNFGLGYGMQVKSLAERTGSTEEEAQEKLDAFFANYSRVKEWIDNAQKTAKRDGYVTSYFGRKNTIWSYQSTNRAVYSKGDRDAINYPIQGFVGDLAKIAILKAKKLLQTKGWWGTHVKAVMNQHDSWTFEVRDEIDPVLLRDLLTPITDMVLPKFPVFKTDWQVADRWGAGLTFTKATKVARVDGVWKVLEGEGFVKEDDEPDEFFGFEEDEEAEDIGPDAWEEEAVDIKVELEPAEYEVGPKTLVLVMNDMPETDNFARFTDMLKARPGENFLEIKTPVGEFKATRCGFTLDDKTRIGLALGVPVELFWASSSIDPAEIIQGLEL